MSKYYLYFLMFYLFYIMSEILNIATSSLYYVQNIAIAGRASQNQQSLGILHQSFKPAE